MESGKNADRPQLARALDACRLTGSVLVIAKLDRLLRDAHFLLGLEKAGVEFVAADMPNLLAPHVPALAGNPACGWSIPAAVYAFWEPLVAWGFILGPLSFF